MQSYAGEAAAARSAASGLQRELAVLCRAFELEKTKTEAQVGTGRTFHCTGVQSTSWRVCQRLLRTSRMRAWPLSLSAAGLLPGGPAGGAPGGRSPQGGERQGRRRAAGGCQGVGHGGRAVWRDCIPLRLQFMSGVSRCNPLLTGCLTTAHRNHAIQILPALDPLLPKVEVAARKAAEESEKKALRTAAKQVRISTEMNKRWYAGRKSNGCSVSVDEGSAHKEPITPSCQCSHMLPGPTALLAVPGGGAGRHAGGGPGGAGSQAARGLRGAAGRCRARSQPGGRSAGGRGDSGGGRGGRSPGARHHSKGCGGGNLVAGDTQLRGQAGGAGPAACR